MSDYAFKITCGEKVYTVHASGAVRGFDPMGGALLIDNRIPSLMAQAVHEAVAAEREACAKIIEELLRVANTHRNVGRDEETFAVSAIAKIRARGQTT